MVTKDKQGLDTEALYKGLKPPKQPKPTPEYVRTRVGQLIPLWAPTHTHWDYVDRLINDMVDLWPGVKNDDEKRALGQYHSGKARNIIDTAAAVFLASDPRVHREPTGEGEEAGTNASTAEKWAGAFLNSTDRKQMESPDMAARKYIVTYNYVVKKQPTLEESAVEQLNDVVEHSDAQRAFSPIVITCPNPRSVLMNPYQKFPKEAIALLRLTGEDLAEIAEANEGHYIMPSDPMEEQLCYEYYSRSWHALVPESGEAIFVRRNLLDYQPYDHAFGPAGMLSGDMRDSRWLERKCVGILEPALSLLVMLDQLLNAEQFYMLQASFLKVVGPGDPTDLAQQLRQRIIEGTAKDVGYLIPPNLPQSISDIRSHIEQLIEEVTFPRILAGYREPGATTLGENAILHTSGARKFQGYLQALEFLASQTVSKAFRLVMQWQQAVTIDGITLKPETLDGDDNAQVVFPYLDAVLELQKGESALAEYQAGTIDFERYHEIKGREDVQAIRMGLFKDAAYKHPALVEHFSQVALEQMGVADIVKDFERKQRMAGLVDPRGNPLASGGGQPEPMRQPLTPDVAKPPQMGAEDVTAMAGGMNG